MRNSFNSDKQNKRNNENHDKVLMYHLGLVEFKCCENDLQNWFYLGWGILSEQSKMFHGLGSLKGLYGFKATQFFH